MRSEHRSLQATLLCALAVALVLAPAAWAAPKFKVLHSFTDGNDGGALSGSLLLDSGGNVYGTTRVGGPYGGGTVFELTLDAGGTWTLTNLYNFCTQPECSDGNAPFAGVIFDNAGNLYGTTNDGGTYENGVVFELTPQADGTWSETIPHSFQFGDHGGCCPFAGVTTDGRGDLYGVVGGAYELSPGSGGWTYDVLHVFTGQNGDGLDPYAGLIRDSSSNFYGTTELGGTDKRCGGGCGTVYKLRRMPDGSWQETILHDFGAPGDGAFPGVGALILNASGSLYGTTNVGGGHGYGTVFRLTPGPHGRWHETILHSFTGKGTGGLDPAGVVMDKAGNLYGTTNIGGDPNCYCGMIYKLAPHGKNQWKYTVLHRFLGLDGAFPTANLILDGKGNLYGTTELGGTYNLGVAFELTP